MFSDIEDTYFTLHFKTLASIGWIGRSVKGKSKIKWVFKIDDDVLVNHWRLESYIQTLSKEDNVFHCKIMYDREPLRSPDSKWYLTKMDWLKPRFPTYCLGPFYMFSPSTASRIFAAFEETVHSNYLAMEDVYITGN